MGRDARRKTDKKVPVEVEEEEEVEEEVELDELDQDELLGIDGGQEEQDIRKQQQEVLEIIKAQTERGADGEKLTWLALYSLKHREMQLTEDMNQEINAIKDKFQLLKQPIHDEIAKAATGEKISKDLYINAGQKSQSKPAPLPNYWQTVFQNSGLIQEPQDIDAFSKLSNFKCDLLDGNSRNFKLSFSFREETSLFRNRQLVIETKTLVVDGKSENIVTNTAIDFKGSSSEASIFYTLFRKGAEAAEQCDLVAEFYRDYCNSIYFYLRKGELEIEGESEEEGEEDDEPPPKSKPAKKVKKEGEKPECKNQ